MQVPSRAGELQWGAAVVTAVHSELLLPQGLQTLGHEKAGGYLVTHVVLEESYSTAPSV